MKKALALVLSLVVFTLCGCAAQREAAPMENSVVFTDALGREVTVEKKPERVAALIGSFADIWQLSGGTVCATAEDAWDDLGLELGDAVSLGGAHSPSLETLLSIADALGVTADALLVGNQQNCHYEYDADLEMLFYDCSATEKRFLFDILKAAKEAIRKNGWIMGSHTAETK